MAGGTVINDTGMIKHTGGKTADAMAHTAILGRGYVRRQLAHGERAVVARGTIIRNAIMIEGRGAKRRC